MIDVASEIATHGGVDHSVVIQSEHVNAAILSIFSSKIVTLAKIPYLVKWDSQFSTQ